MDESINVCQCKKQSTTQSNSSGFCVCSPPVSLTSIMFFVSLQLFFLSRSNRFLKLYICLNELVFR
jgi:hypothetical protein